MARAKNKLAIVTANAQKEFDREAIEVMRSKEDLIVTGVSDGRQCSFFSHLCSALAVKNIVGKLDNHV
jgi:hypothetical protein